MVLQTNGLPLSERQTTSGLQNCCILKLRILHRVARGKPTTSCSLPPRLYKVQIACVLLGGVLLL